MRALGSLESAKGMADGIPPAIIVYWVLSLRAIATRRNQNALLQHAGIRPRYCNMLASKYADTKTH